MDEINKLKLVSILIPAYNVEKYIERSLESALNQTYKNIEVVVVDDGSTDGTAEIIKKYQSDRRVKYVYQNNKGLASARNTAMKNAEGEYFAMLDADDVFLPEKIEYQIRYLEANKDCDICYSDLWLFYENKPDQLVKTSYKFYSGSDVFPQLLKRSFINTLTVMLRRSAVNKFGYLNEKYRYAEDLEYFLRLSYAGAKFCFLNEKLAKFCIRQVGHHQSGFESDLNNKLSTLQIYEELSQKMTDEERDKYNMKRHIGFWQMKCALVYLINKNKKESLKYFLKSAKTNFLLSPIILILSVFSVIIPIKLISFILYKLQILRRLYFLDKENENI